MLVGGQKDSRGKYHSEMHCGLVASGCLAWRWLLLFVPRAFREHNAVFHDVSGTSEGFHRQSCRDVWPPRFVALHVACTTRKEPGHEIQVREKLATPKLPHPLLALRVGCDWSLLAFGFAQGLVDSARMGGRLQLRNKTELVFDGDVSAVSASSTGPHSC